MIKHPRIVGAILAATLFSAAQGAQLNSDFRPIGGNQWTVDLTLVGDGDPAEIRSFSSYFAENLFADLLLLAAPAPWDGLVIQPDLALASPGFLDALLVDGGGVSAGQSVAGFKVQFSYLGNGRPPELPFEILDADYQVLYAGITTPVTLVPEPATPAMLLLGMGAWVLLRRAQGAAPLPGAR